MRVVFRCDSSLQIGSGHLMRCLTLAQELRRKGAEVEFVCRAHFGNLNHLVKEQGFALHELQESPEALESIENCKNTTKHQAWLGVCQEQDAAETAEILQAHKPDDTKIDWLVVDHYALDKTWQKPLKSLFNKLLVIDDLADREHLCDALLDQNLLLEADKNLYQTKIPAKAKQFLGPQFALLKPEYPATAKQLKPRSGEVNRLLIFVGASDLTGLSEHFLQALNHEDFQDLAIDLVLGSNHQTTQPDLVAGLKQHKNQKIAVHQNLPSLAPLMAKADLMLGAGGTTNWERLCLGLNSVIASLADNQDSVNAKLGELGLIYFLGRAENLQLATSRKAIKHCLANPQELAKRSQKMQELVKGQGAKIVADYMFEQADK